MELSPMSVTCDKIVGDLIAMGIVKATRSESAIHNREEPIDCFCFYL